ncbi:MAG TPA: hypothetical protein VN428_05070 [Bryobacteraceae bacterium]|nr:hypothetical protein [Bryobacteraceae bacterium]
MRATVHRAQLLACCVLLVAAGVAPARPPEKPADAIAALAGALSDGDAGAFLARVDEHAPGYAELARNVRALVALGPAASSVDPVEDKGDAERRSMRLNWILDIRGSRRRATILCDLERRGDKWHVTRLEPVAFFSSQQ